MKSEHNSVNKDHVESILNELGLASRTRLIPVLAGALESKKQDSLFKDLIAKEIIFKSGLDYHRLIMRIPELYRIALIARHNCFKRLIKDFIRRYPKAAIVNIGCGLNTFYESVCDSDITWYDLDIPKVIDLRRLFFTETDDCKFISFSSFLDDCWLGQIKYNENILFVAEGIFYYYEEKTIKKLLVKLSSSFPDSEFIFDVTSPIGVMATNQILIKLFTNNENPLKWGLKNVETIMSWNPKFRLLGKYYTFKQQSLKTSLQNRILGLISDALNIQYTVHIRVRPDYLRIKRK